MANDLSLDRGAIGLLASVFFYSYAVFQMPWGIASDRFGNRSIVALGIALTALTMVGFATGHTQGSLIFWRIASGVAAAAVYVPLTGAIARWFPERERSFSQGTLGGVGGTLGEAAAYFLLPVLAVYFASGWRQGTNIIAGAIGVIAISVRRVSQVRTLRPASDDQKAVRLDAASGSAAVVLCVPLLRYSSWEFAARRPGSRCTSADVNIARYGMSLNQAVVYGGFFALVAYSVLGRAVGCPLAGKLTDILARRGISRTVVLMGWLALAIALLLFLSTGVTAFWPLAVVTVLLGMSVNLFALVPAAISETYGSQRTASVVVIREHARPVCRRDRAGRQRLRRHLAEHAARQCADGVPGHLAFGARGNGDHGDAGNSGVHRAQGRLGTADQRCTLPGATPVEVQRQ